MRAVTKLERRFRRSLANLEADTGADVSSEEIDKFSKQIEALEAENSRKDAEIQKLQSEIASLSEAGAKAASELAELKTAHAATQKEIQKEMTTLQTTLEAATAAKAAAEMQLASLKETTAPAPTGADPEIVADLKARLEVSEGNSVRYFKRMRELRNTMRQMRAGLKGNVLNAEDVNTALEAELEALQAQREIDLIEVNIILEKLTPLVEGK
ncbi:MAG: hypothetical protein QM492_04450 [Rhodobacterales bacterium]